MGSDVHAILDTFSLRELKDLAKAHGVGAEGVRAKADLVDHLAAEQAIQAAVRKPSMAIRPFLAAKGPRELQALAGDFQVDVAGCKKKADFVARIAASPAAEQILMKARGAIEVLEERPDIVHPDADAAIQRNRNLDIDFGLVEDVLDQARMRFEERNFDRALELAHESLLLARGTLDAFERVAWAYALLASHFLIEESGRVGRDVLQATALLRDAKVVYLSGNLDANRDLLLKLQVSTKALYSDEVRRVRQTIYELQEQISQAAHVGGDVVGAEEALAHAKEAMEHSQHAQALKLLEDAERLTEKALEDRMREIRETIPATEKVIEDARQMGADVEEAVRLLEKARVAFDRQEYVLAGELVERAERSALQSQHYQIQKAMDLRMRLIGKAQDIINMLHPIVDEAASFGIDVEESRRLLADAQNVLDQGDYVNGMMGARRAEEVVRRLEPLLVEERTKRGITRPTAGRCATCGSPAVSFLDDGWGRCNTCGAVWRWRGSARLWDRFRTLLRE